MKQLKNYLHKNLTPWLNEVASIQKIPVFNLSRLTRISHHAIKDAHGYAVQVSDTTMLPIAASLFGQ